MGHVYADLIRAYRTRYPKVELTLVEYGGRRIEQAVLEGSWISLSPCCRPKRGRPQRAGAGSIPDPGSAA